MPKGTLQEIQKEPIINVGIVSAELIEFELKGNFIYNKHSVKTGKYKAHINNKLISTSFVEKVQVIKLEPADSKATFVLNKVEIGIGFHWQQTEMQEFEGALTLIIENGKITAINNIALECYLKSVISSEMSAMNNPTLLQAHAIISRSWLISQLLAQKNKYNTRQVKEFHHYQGRKIECITRWYDREDHQHFDVCADDHCQRYQGISKIISINASAAIEATRGLAITFNGNICDARYSKCCGGISENFENVWENKKIPYLAAINDSKNSIAINNQAADDFILSSPEAFCNTSDPQVLNQVLIDFDRATTRFFRWELSYSQSEISKIIYNKSGIDFGRIIDLIPLERGISGRIIKLLIIGEKQEIIVGKELEIRKWLSNSHLYSSAFMVTKKFNNNESFPSTFTLTGAGWGHGVGLCQIGAAVMAREGYSIYEILSHYFKGTQLSKLY